VTNFRDAHLKIEVPNFRDTQITDNWSD